MILELLLADKVNPSIIFLCPYDVISNAVVATMKHFRDMMEDSGNGKGEVVSSMAGI